MEHTRPTGESSEKKPLVATLAISPSAQRYFNELRTKHFPAERNYIDAHLTLFHALPDESWLVTDLERLAESQQSFEATAQSIVSLGNGTAFKITSPELPLMHQRLQKSWFDSLTPQDRQKRNFHITIQNKVDSLIAKKLQEEVKPDFQPFSFTVYGIHLWRYLGGPWEYVRSFDFIHS